MAWFEEFLLILAYSKKTQLAIWLGVISFMLILALGAYVSNHINFVGIFAPLANVIRKVFLDRYEMEAWLSLVSCLMLAAKSYNKDRKRLLCL